MQQYILNYITYIILYILGHDWLPKMRFDVVIQYAVTVQFG